jgi:hypothetical protein
MTSVVTMRQDFAGSAGGNAATLTVTVNALVDVCNWTFLLGSGLMPSTPSCSAPCSTARGWCRGSSRPSA